MEYVTHVLRQVENMKGFGSSWAQPGKDGYMATSVPTESFILRYQEPTSECTALAEPTLGTQTRTEAKEETDQDKANQSMLAGTKTATAVQKESTDVDRYHLEQYQVLPGRQQVSHRSPSLGTQTMTKAKEEPDQDEQHEAYAAL